MTQSHISILVAHPLFKALSASELDYLNDLFTREDFKLGSTIVSEDDIVDCIYFIVSGFAEVSKFGQPIATLSKGECIGLNTRGLYSVTGKRTATVIAQCDVVTLKLTLHQFQLFLDTHPEIQRSLQENVKLFSRMHLLKLAAPFAELPLARLHELAEHIKEVHVPKDTYVFRQGDEGQCCYLIESGSIDISITIADQIKPLATLEANDIFGEAALLLDIPRNATARANSDTTLLVLDKSLIINLLHTETSTAESLLMLQQARSRPLQINNIELYNQKTCDGTALITLKNPNNNKYFRLSHYGLFIWEKLDGLHSLSDITLAFYQQFNIFNPSIISSLIIDLHHAGFVQLDQPTQFLPHKSLPMLTRVLLRLRATMETKWVFTNVDSWLTYTYQHVIWPLYTKVGQAVLLSLCLSGLILFVMHTASVADLLNTSPHKWSLVIIASLLGLISTVLHELAHAYTTKAYGKQVHSFGIGWYWLGPMAFCDTSDMWLADRRARIAVDLSGIYLNLCLAGIAGWCLCFSSSANGLIIIWLFGLMNYMSAMINLNPAMELDGYYTLMDWFDKPNLRASALDWLSTRSKPYGVEAYYWLLTILYILFMEILVPFLMATYLLHGLFNIQSSLISLGIVLIVVSISGLSLWLEIKQKRTP